MTTNFNTPKQKATKKQSFKVMVSGTDDDGYPTTENITIESYTDDICELDDIVYRESSLNGASFVCIL